MKSSDGTIAVIGGTGQFGHPICLQLAASTPLSPPSAPVQTRLQSPPAKSKFLAVSQSVSQYNGSFLHIDAHDAEHLLVGGIWRNIRHASLTDHHVSAYNRILEFLAKKN